ncbi:MAG: ABC transporter ATP-binding protein [Spirochaetales bacterium]|nr:ABC transporter ATP-binding protein [Spirochaetales bacterium]
MNAPLLEVRGLKKYFPVRKNMLWSRQATVRAVDDVSFAVMPSETIGLVGESGCGKTTLGRVISLLLRPTAGKITFDGRVITGLRGRALHRYRHSLQIIFQDPYSSLNPRKTVFDIVLTGIRAFGIVKTKKALMDKAEALLTLVGLSPQYLHHYPHEFSGGQRQRISIARTLAVNPRLVICDEPVSALDVSIQAQILNLLNELKQQLSLSYIFISHDLSVVKYLSDRIFVMYRGKIVEKAAAAELFARTAHPYSKALISAIPEPVINQTKKTIILKGDVTTPVGAIEGCCFRERCYMAQAVCRTTSPPDREIHPGHFSCCHFAEQVAPPAGGGKS